MRSSLFITEVNHCRIGAVTNSFTYPSLSCVVDLDELVQLDSQIPLFGYNRFNLLSINDKDYLPGKDGTIKQRLFDYLRSYGYNPELICYVELLTSPRYLGYVFNPVSFYRCLDQQRNTLYFVAEVNNTFGETHLYILNKGEQFKAGQRYEHPKEFHVSPFYDLNGEYKFLIDYQDDHVDIHVNLHRHGRTAFTSRISGKRENLNFSNLGRVLLHHPLLPWLTMPRICYQALRLYLRRLTVYSKPIAISSMTIKKSAPSLYQRTAIRLISRALENIKVGGLEIRLPNGERLFFGSEEEQNAAVISVRDYRFFTEILWGGDIAFGETYVDNLWDTPDLLAVFRVFLTNLKTFNDRDLVWTKVGQWVGRLYHRSRANSPHQSKHNIAAHYDLGNKLFSKFLDSRMVYSAAQFNTAEDSLEQAQLNKVHSLINKARIVKSDHVLEIGSGWGAFAIEAARTTGCRVTTITLSEEQFAFTNEAVAKAGLSDRITVRLVDYRSMDGCYDKIVSIEMLEAVGHENLPIFFQQCDRLLKPNGLLVLQFINFPESRYESYKRSCDWIQRYIFPGGHCPSITAVLAAAAKGSSLMAEHLENIGPDYARTLREWLKRFRSSASEISAAGYDPRFFRMWEYYLQYCEAGFAERILGTIQLVMTRASNNLLPPSKGYPV